MAQLAVGSEVAAGAMAVMAESPFVAERMIANATNVAEEER
jgi:hypothetical protein